jgi:hypothetical protein
VRFVVTDVVRAKNRLKSVFLSRGLGTDAFVYDARKRTAWLKELRECWADREGREGAVDLLLNVVAAAGAAEALGHSDPVSEHREPLCRRIRALAGAGYATLFGSLAGP